MVTIEVYASIHGRVINWLFDGKTEQNAVIHAKQVLREKGLYFKDYILV